MQKVTMREGPSGPELVFPTPFNVAAALLDPHIEEGRGKRTAILSLNETVTYETLAANVNRHGNALLKLGLKPGDRALMIVRDAPEFYYVFLGAVRAGIIPVPLNTMLTPNDYKFIISDSGAKALVYSLDFKDKVDAATTDPAALRHIIPAVDANGSLAELASKEPTSLAAYLVKPDAECFWLYSSGTTGKPKGIVHNHRAIIATTQLYSVNVLGARDGDVYYSIPRLFFAYGLGCAMTFPLWVGGAAVLDSRRPTPEIAAELIRRFKPTIFAALPTFYAALLAANVLDRESLAGLHRAISGAEVLPNELQRRWLDVAPVPIVDGIGSTEVLHIYISNSPANIHQNSCGRPVPGYQCRILDETGTEIQDDRPGRLWVKGPSVTTTYWNNPEKTKASIVDGWIDTGDTIRRDNEGYYYVCGRTDEMLKVGGIWVSPFEIETTIMDHPAVLEVAIVGRNDDAGMIKPEAWIVLKNASAKSEKLALEITNLCKKNLAPYKYPRWINFVESLPKTATGKIQRSKLRAPGRY